MAENHALSLRAAQLGKGTGEKPVRSECKLLCVVGPGRIDHAKRNEMGFTASIASLVPTQIESNRPEPPVEPKLPDSLAVVAEERLIRTNERVLSQVCRIFCLAGEAQHSAVDPVLMEGDQFREGARYVASKSSRQGGGCHDLHTMKNPTEGPDVAVVY